MDYPAHLYAEWRAEIERAHALSAENGRWIAATTRDLTPQQTVQHVRFGIGDCVEQTSLGIYICRFSTYDDGDQFRSETCWAIDLEGFEYFRPFEARQQDLIDAQTRIFSGVDPSLRKLIDGWHL